MTREAAIQNFFSSFGLTAYKSTAVPDDVTFPYLTYTDESSGFYDSPVSLTVNLWFYTDSEAAPNAKVRELENRIGNGGAIVSYDNGAVWFTKGSPWCQSLTDDTSPTIKRRYLNVYRTELTNI